MATYRITKDVTRKELRTVEAASASEALEAHAAACGYRSYADYLDGDISASCSAALASEPAARPVTYEPAAPAHRAGACGNPRDCGDPTCRGECGY